MLKDVTLGQFFPGSTPIHKLDPRTKLVLVIVYIVALFLAKWFVSYVVVAAFLAMVIAMSRIRLKVVLKNLKPLLFIILLTAVLNLFYGQGEPIAQFWIFKITKSGLENAIFMVLRISLLVAGTFMLTYTTSPISLTDGLESLLSPLKKLHAPVHELSMMMSIALRFIPTLIEETDKIMSAQKARGADFESGNLLSRAKAMVPILVPLFISAFRRADELATAMECRCYHGGEGRTKLCRAALSDARLGRVSHRRGAARRDDRAAALRTVKRKEAMRNIALTLQYLGTAYHGWQVQKTVMTVGQTLEEAAAAVVRPSGAYDRLRPHGRRRPRAGVRRQFPDHRAHSLRPAAVRAQYAPARGYRRVRTPWRSMTTSTPSAPASGRNIPISSITPGSGTRFMSTARGSIPNTSTRPSCSVRPTALSVRTILRPSAPSAPTSSPRSARSIITRSSARATLSRLRVCANGFLYNMARAMAGTCVYAAEGKFPPEDVAQILLNGDRTAAGPTVPPGGLYMTKLWYDDGKAVFHVG